MTPLSWSPVEAAILAVAPAMHLTVGTDPFLPGPAGRAEVGMVVVDGTLFVRASLVGAWVSQAVAQKLGRIRTGTIDRAVRFTPYTGPSEAIDAAYTAKYGDHGGLLTHPKTRRTTFRVDPTEMADPQSHDL